jgi:flagellar hook-length control protein FliK
MSAYGGRGHEGSERGGDRGGEGTRSSKREEERAAERVSDTSNPYIPDPIAPLPEQQLVPQQQPTLEARPQNVPQNQPAPAAAPPQELPDVVFQGRPDPTAATENASISLHHPDLGPIQLEVHRELGRVEVHAVIETQHAQAVLRANENGIRQGVQQAGMTFNALRVRLRSEEQPTSRGSQERRRRNNERGT